MNEPLGLRRFGPGQVLPTCLLLLALTWRLSADDEPPKAVAPATSAPPAAADVVVTNNAAGELRAAQEAIEQLRRDLEHNATRNADAITAGLSVIEPALARQLEAVRSSNQTILLVAGLFAGIAVLALVIISLILMR